MRNGVEVEIGKEVVRVMVVARRMVVRNRIVGQRAWPRILAVCVGCLF